MCDPVTIAGMALTGASIAANSSAQGDVNRARDRAITGERGNQASLDEEIASLNAGSQDRYTDFGAKEDAKTGSLADFFGGLSEPGHAASVMPASHSTVTNEAIDKEMAAASAYGTQQDQSLAKLRSFGDVLGDIGRDQARDATQIGELGSFKRGSAGVNSLELNAANEAGGKKRLLGDVLALVGSTALKAGIGTPTASPWAATTVRS